MDRPRVFLDSTSLPLPNLPFPPPPSLPLPNLLTVQTLDSKSWRTTTWTDPESSWTPPPCPCLTCPSPLRPPCPCLTCPSPLRTARAGGGDMDRPRVFLDYTSLNLPNLPFPPPTSQMDRPKVIQVITYLLTLQLGCTRTVHTKEPFCSQKHLCFWYHKKH